MAASVSILGAGAWGTAIGVHLARIAREGQRITLWARSAEQASHIDADRENARYLPGVALPATVRVTSDLGQAARSDVLLLAPPVAALPGLVQALAGLGCSAPLLWVSKGLVSDDQGVRLPHQVIAPSWRSPIAVASGPSFAHEVAKGLPTALAVAGSTSAFADQAAALLRGGTLRTYPADDLVGVEIGGAVKNVLAIAAGASDGLGFGHNARAALITRGLAEATRLAVAMGGRAETLAGLSGLGDLVLTCTGDASRNRRVGLALARGEALAKILRDLGHVAEGVPAARGVRALSARHGVEMPISTAVDRVLHEGVPVRDAVEALLSREPRREG